jgi:hypothetical protein
VKVVVAGVVKRVAHRHHLVVLRRLVKRQGERMLLGRRVHSAGVTGLAGSA